MSKILEKPDFQGQIIYVGIDVHLKSWNISIYCDDIFLKTFNQPACPDTLKNFLAKHYPGADFHCTYESGFCGFWIQRQLEDSGIKCSVVNAADVPQTDKGVKNKTDQIDSRRLAQALKSGYLQANYIPDQELEADRQLVRTNSRLNNDIVRAKNRVKSHLYRMGIEIPDRFSKSNWSNQFIKWLKSLDQLSVSDKSVLKLQINLVEYLKVQKLEVLKQIRSLMKKERYSQIAKYLYSVPGIGPLTTARLITEIGEIKRFSSFKQLNCFIGFYPTEHSSGEMTRKGRMTSRGHHGLRSALLESAWIAIRTDPAMTITYQNLKIKIGGKRAIIKIARKLLSRIRHVWLYQEIYEKGMVK